MYDPHDRRILAAELADAFLSGPWTAERVAESGAGALDGWPSWMSALAMHVVAAHRAPPVRRRVDLVAVIEAFLAGHPASAGDATPPGIISLTAPSPHRGPRPLKHDWPIAPIDSVAALARGLELSDGQLAWLADVRGLERTVADERLRNYRYAAVPRRSGLPRVIEAPKARLKEIQRWLLHEILDHVATHAAAHGFTRGRSVLTHARAHTGQAAVLRLDLADFFASIEARRVFGIFRTLGYAEAVAHALTGLTTNTIPETAWDHVSTRTDPRLVGPRFRLGRQLATPHLPQGAPTSPALANLAAFRLDRRLAGLAAAMDLRYSRYADDLTFSGTGRLRRQRIGLENLVAEIAREEGFRVNAGKSTLRTAASRQRVCGIVVNAHPNVARDEYDRLKAILHNARHHGLPSQNREALDDFAAHLHGRVAWVAQVNPARGEQLRRRFAEIDRGPDAAGA
ncbi:MAG TPA: reverse transcriptase family protein [Solirubrobacteraceae bacterium]|nr:reverse transcriptase family protein [Solirubrobacteraceae bacterium]